MRSPQSAVISPLYMRQLWAQSTVRSKSVNRECTVRSAQSAVVVLHKGKEKEKGTKGKQVYTIKEMNCTWGSVTLLPLLGVFVLKHLVLAQDHVGLHTFYGIHQGVLDVLVYTSPVFETLSHVIVSALALNEVSSHIGEELVLAHFPL
jgi:hypothetical protein